MRSPCQVVLVRPRDPNNIGAAARAMKNFGLTELAVVTPYPPVWDEVVSAVNATDVITQARVVGSLAEAIADCTLVVGTADRTRVEPGQALYTPADLSRELQVTAHRLALVFGQEKRGLTNEDLSHCHQVVSIPTSPECPSMNLGQAVAVCCYELTREQAPRAGAPRRPALATAGEIEAALQLALDVLRRSDFVLPGNEPELTVKLRRSLLRLRLGGPEVKMLCGALRKIRRGLASRPAS
jgi:tRNA/rRNA methyltransferase